MKKGALLNSELSHVIGQMGHTDLLTIADAGLPIPLSVRRIDLALTENVPSFIQTLETVLNELKVEKVHIAGEMRKQNAALYDTLIKLFEGIEINQIPHEAFKEKTKQSRAIVRTGECSPYANIILESGVVF